MSAHAPFTAAEFNDLIRRQALGRPAGTLDYHGNVCCEYSGPPVAPVQVVECVVCGGTGVVDQCETTVRCVACAGRGRIATEGGEI